MAGVRAMLTRVAKLEAAHQPRPSPFVRAHGSFAAFEALCRDEMAAGKLDRDFPLEALAAWETDETWTTAQGRWR